MARGRFSYPKEKMKILLLEGVHPSAVQVFQENGYQAEVLAQALEEDELSERISSVHLLGIRSKTQVRSSALSHAKSLLGIGCYCIGTNQVDGVVAAAQGIPVFNAPFSNTRSVAELAMAEIVMLARGACEKSSLLHHQGSWEKSAAGSFEVRGKTLGIIGYGHIGPQLGLLAEAFGMQVLYFDILRKLPLGNARTMSSLAELLGLSDFVSLHVPETDQTRNMIRARELKQMKKGSFLLNLSRGSVIEIESLVEALQTQHLAGAAIDVFPDEPSSNAERFESPLRGLRNVILTPHIGGSTKEAQESIGKEVSRSLVHFADAGGTEGAVNFPKAELALREESHRVLHIHRNVPGVLGAVNQIIAEMKVNIHAQVLSTEGDIGYLIMDLGPELSEGVKAKLDALPETIRTRLLF